ncbi:hypothetical protein PQG02_34030 (plasmid) [Nostoc sp. UHCC 0926]|uniref:hypothetical protein n=1 Tax=Nostoc sp. UHCC 0926 TaxID=3025190 RepID=UPI00236238AA|nr:hypothetical protein [Nostoc sp. UHCC 0926]WDD36863.1 hypothetical protein PQG02_34030 [Nostoc sp. UHCC 0926]
MGKFLTGITDIKSKISVFTTSDRLSSHPQYPMPHLNHEWGQFCDSRGVYGCDLLYPKIGVGDCGGGSD